MMRFLTILGIMSFLVGCSTGIRNPTDYRDFRTDSVPTSVFQAMKATAAVLIESGWIIDNSNVDLGIMSASKSTPAELWATAIDGRTEFRERLSLSFFSAGQDRTIIRATINYVILGRRGGTLVSGTSENARDYDEILGRIYRKSLER